MKCHICELESSDVRDYKMQEESWGQPRMMPTCGGCFEKYISVDRPPDKMIRGADPRTSTPEAPAMAPPPGWPKEYVYPPSPDGKLPSGWLWDEQGLRKV